MLEEVAAAEAPVPEAEAVLLVWPVAEDEAAAEVVLGVAV